MERVTGYPSKMKEWIDIVVHWDIKQINKYSNKSWSVSEKSFPQSASPTLRYILPSFGCRSPLRRPHSDKISHKLRLAAHEKPFSDTL